MSKKALIVIDLQNDITKNYREIIDQVNKAVDWAVGNDIDIVYMLLRRSRLMLSFITAST